MAELISTVKNLVLAAKPVLRKLSSEEPGNSSDLVFSSLQLAVSLALLQIKGAQIGPRLLRAGRYGRAAGEVLVVSPLTFLSLLLV